MKSFYFCALALAFSLPVLAQDSVTTLAQLTPTGSRNDPEWFNKTIKLDIRNATLEDAIKKVMDAAGVKIEKVDDQTKGKNNKLSLRLDDVNVRDALAAVSRLYGAQAYVLNEDGKTIIELRKRSAADPVIRTLTGPGGFSGQGAFTPFPGFDSTSIFVTGNTERYKDLPDKKLEISVKEGTALDVIKQICEKAGLEYELDKELKAEDKISITMTGVSVGNALDNAANWLGCGWKAEKTGDKVKVSFSKKYPHTGLNWSRGTARSQGGAFATAPMISDLPVIGTLFRSAKLPQKRVSLDKKDADVRDSLKDVLKQAELSYAIADDLPTGMKSFTFADVPIATALDVICESIEVGWVAESGPDGKPIVRIGKRYKGRSTSNSNAYSLLNRFATPSPTQYNALQSRYNNLSGSYRTTAPRSQRIPIDYMLL